MLEFEVVLANSSAIRASQTSNTDLFWALRGGGPNFGIVTSVTLEAFSRGLSSHIFQRWNMADMQVAFQRLDRFSHYMPPGIQMIATNLGWSAARKEFVLSDRIVAPAAGIPEISRFPSDENPTQQKAIRPIIEYAYKRTTLQMAEVMDVVNEFGFYNIFGSITVQSNPQVHMKSAEIFQKESRKKPVRFKALRGSRFS